MIAEFNTELPAMKVNPEMRNKKAVAQDGGHVTVSVPTTDSRLGQTGSRQAGSPLRRIFTVLLAPLVLATLLAGAGRCAQPEGATWLSGPALERQLQTPVALLRWSSIPLRSALQRLADSQRVAMFLDRRIDPDQTVDLDCQDEPLTDVIQRLAERADVGTCRVGPVIYFGPRETASVLATVAELRQQDLQTWREGDPDLRRPRPMAWPELGTPRELIEQQAQSLHLSVANLELIPHDLWPAADLPALNPGQRLSLLLAGFGLTFELADDRMRLSPMPARVSLDREYNLSDSMAARIEQRLGEAFPQAEVIRRPGGLTVKGTIEAQQAVEDWIHGRSNRPAKPPAAGQVLYTLEIKNQPVGAIAKGLAERLGLQIEFDPQVQDRLQARVSFRVQQVTQNELLQALFAPAGLGFRLTGDVLTVEPVD